MLDWPTVPLLRFVACCAVALVAPLSAQTQFGALEKADLPGERDQSTAVALVDVDRDGDRDMVIANYGQTKLYLNSGTGVFTDVTQARMPADNGTTNAIAVGDVDGDGDSDLVLANVGQPFLRQNRLYLNDGNGRFTDATAARMPADNDSTLAVVLGDVDGDGDPDLVLGNQPAQFGMTRNKLYLNDGTGTFLDATATHMPPDADGTFELALVDVDGDGDSDLVLANASGASRQNRLYLNDGRGVFSDVTAARMPVDDDLTFAVAAADVDGDGDPDLAFGNGGTSASNRLYLNDGSGTFTDVTAAKLPPDDDLTTSLEFADVDGDGDRDLIVGNDFVENRLYANDGTGTFTDVTLSRMPGDGYSTTDLAVADADGDGDLDIAVAVFYDQNRLYLGDGSGSFVDPAAPRIPASTTQTYGMVAGDVDGDGDLDLVLGDDRAQNRLYVNDGNARFTNATASGMPPGGDATRAVALGDLDRDGDLDVVVANDSEQNRLYLGGAGASFIDATGSRMPPDQDRTFCVSLGDVDGDGDLDVVFGNFGAQNRLLRNDGTGRLTDDPTALPADTDYTLAVVLHDVDADGDLDLLTGNAGNPGAQNRLYVNDGSGRFTDVTATRLPVDNDYTNALVLGDLDGDGDDDLVLANDGPPSGSHQNKLYLNDGSGGFVDATAARLPVDTDDTDAVALGDVDEDGDLDIVLTGDPTKLYLNDGSATFADVTASRMPGNPDRARAFVLADLDADGDLDLAVAGLADRLYTNRLRQVWAPNTILLGAPYPVELHAMAGFAVPGQLVLPFFSLAEATPKIPILPLGFWGLPLTGLVTGPVLAVPAPSGEVVLPLVIPNAPAFRGLTLFAQAVVAHGANPTSWRFSNVMY